MSRTYFRSLARLVGAVALTATSALAGSPAESAPVTPDVTLNVVNILTAQNVKVWVPESIFAKKGDVVQLRLINKLDKEHGYSIAAFGIQQVIPAESAQTIVFTADKAGIFPINCQLHPPHVAGQLVVLE